MTPASGRKTVLVIDDEPELQFLYSEMLKRLGYRALTAADLNGALEMFSANRNDTLCILLDMAIPGSDGSEIMKSLREIDRNARIIISSGSDKSDIKALFTDLDQPEFIQKPYGLSQLKNAIEHPLSAICTAG